MVTDRNGITTTNDNYLQVKFKCETDLEIFGNSSISASTTTTTTTTNVFNNNYQSDIDTKKFQITELAALEKNLNGNNNSLTTSLELDSMVKPENELSATDAENDILQSAKIFYSTKNDTFLIHCENCESSFESVPLFIGHYCSKENPNYVPKQEFVQLSVEDCNKFDGELSIGADGLWHCRMCNKKYEKRSILRKHEQAHLNVFPCEICGKSLKSIVSFREHMNTHLGNKPYLCVICKMNFARKWALISHIRCHLGDKRYSCEKCGKEFVNGAKVKLHLRMVHTKEKPYMCDICGKHFYSNQLVTQHKKRHYNIRKYKCDQCDKAFFDKQQLTRHFITHTGERPFACELCPATFPRKKTLEAHLKTHSGIKDFLCPLCGKGFAVNENLTKHLKCHAKGTLLKKSRDPNAPVKKRPITSKVSKILAELVKTNMTLEEQQKHLIATLQESGGAISASVLNIDTFREQVMKVKQAQKRLETPRPTKKLTKKKQRQEQLQLEQQHQLHSDQISFQHQQQSPTVVPPPFFFNNI